MTLGTSGNDHITGGSGSDHINGAAGNDRIRGAGGADVVKGGAGNDAFIFRPGDLVPSSQANADGPTNGVQDVIYDFHTRGSGPEADFAAFVGFSAGSTLVFDRGSTVNPHLGYYHVHDAASGIDYSLAIVNATGTSPIGIHDYNFY